MVLELEKILNGRSSRCFREWGCLIIEKSVLEVPLRRGPGNLNKTGIFEQSHQIYDNRMRNNHEVKTLVFKSNKF